MTREVYQIMDDEGDFQALASAGEGFNEACKAAMKGRVMGSSRE